MPPGPNAPYSRRSASARSRSRSVDAADPEARVPEAAMRAPDQPKQSCRCAFPGCHATLPLARSGGHRPRTSSTALPPSPRQAWTSHVSDALGFRVVVELAPPCTSTRPFLWKDVSFCMESRRDQVDDVSPDPQPIAPVCSGPVFASRPARPVSQKWSLMPGRIRNEN